MMATRGTPRPTPRPTCIPVDDELLSELDAEEEEEEEELGVAVVSDAWEVIEAVPADVVAPATDDEDDDDDDDVVVADVVEADVLVEPEEVDIDEPTV